MSTSTTDQDTLEHETYRVLMLTTHLEVVTLDEGVEREFALESADLNAQVTGCLSITVMRDTLMGSDVVCEIPARERPTRRRRKAGQ